MDKLDIGRHLLANCSQFFADKHARRIRVDCVSINIRQLLAYAVFIFADVNLKFGFKVEHKINRVFKEIVQKMQANGEVDEQSHYPSLRKYDIPADFKFILLNSRVSADDALSPFDQFIVRTYRSLKKIAVPPAIDFGLEGGNFEVETGVRWENDWLPGGSDQNTELLLNAGYRYEF